MDELCKQTSHAHQQSCILAANVVASFKVLDSLCVASLALIVRYQRVEGVTANDRKKFWKKLPACLPPTEQQLPRDQRRNVHAT